MNYRLPLAILIGLAPTACGGSAKDEFPAQAHTGSGTGGTNSIISISGTGGGSLPSGSGASSPGTGSTGGPSCANADFNGCAGELYEGEGLTLDIYIMFDQSG